MNPLFIIPFSIILSLFLYKAYIWLNRGKKKMSEILFFVGYSLSLSIIITLAAVSEEKPSPFLYFPIMFGLLFSVLVFDIINIFKGRQNYLPFLLLLTGILCSVFVPYLGSPPFMIAFAALGMILQVSYFLYLRRYPFLYSMWLLGAAKNSAKTATKNCMYSPKPVIIPQVFKKRWVTATMNGLFIVIKKDKAIIRMTQNLHEQLGKPNLMEFGRNIVKVILSNQSRNTNRRGVSSAN